MNLLRSTFDGVHFVVSHCREYRPYLLGEIGLREEAVECVREYDESWRDRNPRLCHLAQGCAFATGDGGIVSAQ